MNWFKFCRITIEDCVFLPGEQKLINNQTKETITLTEQPNTLLCRLVMTPNQAILRDDLIELLWGDRYETGNKGLNNVIWQLRKNFENLQSQVQIEADRSHKSGYQLNAKVTITWQHHHAQGIAIILDEAQRHITVGHQILPLEDQTLKLVKTLIEEPTHCIAHIAELMQSSEFEVLEAILSLQLKLHQRNEKAHWFKQYDNRFLSFDEITQTTQNEQDNKVKQDQSHQYDVNKLTALNNQLTNKLRFYQATIATIIILAVMTLFIDNSIITDTTITATTHTTSNGSQTDLALTTLKKIKLYNHFSAPIAPVALLDIAQQQFEEHTSDQKILTIEQADYLLNLAEANLFLSRYDTTELLLGKLTLALPTDLPQSRRGQRINLDLYRTKMSFYTATGNYNEAAKYLHLGLSAPTEQLKNDFPLWLFKIASLNLHLQNGQFDKVIKTSETLIKQSPAEQSEAVSLANIQLFDYYSIGLRQTDRSDDAIAALEKALFWEKKLFGDTHTVAFSRINQIATIYTIKGKYQIAMDYFGEALAMKTNHANPDYKALTAVYKNMSFAQFELAQPMAALNSVNQSIELAKQYLQYDLGSLGYYYLTKARHLSHLGDIVQAKLLLDKAMPLIENKAGFNHPSQGRALLLKAQLSRSIADSVGCSSHAALAQSKFSEIYHNQDHWEQTLANMTKLSCKLIDMPKEQEQYLVIVSQLQNTLEVLKNKYGENALPVRKFVRGFSPYLEVTIN